MAEDKNKLSVEIEAKISGLEQGLKEAKKELDTFSKEAEKTASSTDQLEGSGKSASEAIGELGQKMQEVGGKTGEAGKKLSQFAKVLEQGKSFMGGFAVSGGAAVVALGALSAVLAAGAIALYENKDAILENVFGITAITEAYDAAASGIGKQIGRLTQLKDAYSGANTSEEDKLKIMGALQKEFPTYFADLKTEGEALATVQTAYENQKQAIVGLGIAKALEAKKAPIYAKLSELYLKKELSYYDRFKVAIKSLSSAVPGAASLVDVFDGSNTVSDFTEDLEKLNDAIKEIDSDYNLDVLDKLNLNKPGKKGKDSPRDRVAAITGLPTADEFFKFSTLSKEAFENIIGSFSESIDGFNGLTTAIEPLPPLIDVDAMTADELAYLEHLENVKLALNNFNEAASDIINNGISSTFANIGAGIGQALADGSNVISAAGGALLAGVGNVMVELGKLAIATGVGLLAIKLGLESLNPVVAIAAGVALVALGNFVGAKASSIGGNIGGTGGGGRGNYSGSSAGQGSVNYGGSSASQGGFSGSGSGGTVVFEIAGTKLIGVLNNTASRNRALGGSLGIAG